MLNLKKSVNKPFLENVSMRREYIQNFLAPNFYIFMWICILSGKVNLKQIGEQKTILGESGTCSLGKFLEI